MRILVAGATGAVGRRLVPRLVADGHRVEGVARTPERAAGLKRAGALPVLLDLFDAPAVARAVEGRDAVVNLATHIPSTPRMFLPGAWRENDRVRREVSRNLAEGAAAGGVGRLVQESFAPIHHDGGAVWLDERSPVQPASYNRSALDAEAAARRFGESGGEGVVLRFAFFYGPDSDFVHDLVRGMKRGWAMLPGDPEGYFPCVSHDDAADAARAALGVPGGTYLVVDDEPLTRRALADSLATALGVPSPRLPPRWVRPLMGSLGDAIGRSLRLSNAKLRGASEWAPRYPSVREGWPATLAEMEAAV